MVNPLFKSKKYMENIYDQQSVDILINLLVKSYVRLIRCFYTWIIPPIIPCYFSNNYHTFYILFIII